ncbi:MAG: hypothetical protein KAJ16_08140 [Calditrichia bacterium]|nr:hypothetical protein [Calditrichia bacterium]
MKIFGITLILLMILIALGSTYGHGYVFSKANEEMRDNILIEVNQEFMLIKYESVYLGQIAPHIRLMMDSNNDEILTKEEIDRFNVFYKETINEHLKNHSLLINEKPVSLRCVTLFAPQILEDSLLAPLRLEIVLTATDYYLDAGEHELVIDPKALFESGNHFLRLAEEKVDFTLEQEKAIGRFLLINVVGDKNFTFTSSKPGRIRQNAKLAQIYGVFYEDTPLNNDNKSYPLIRIRFTVS